MYIIIGTLCFEPKVLHLAYTLVIIRLYKNIVVVVVTVLSSVNTKGFITRLKASSQADSTRMVRKCSVVYRSVLYTLCVE